MIEGVAGKACCLGTESDMTADQALSEAVPAPGDARLFIGGEYVA